MQSQRLLNRFQLRLPLHSASFCPYSTRLVSTPPQAFHLTLRAMATQPQPVASSSGPIQIPALESKHAAVGATKEQKDKKPKEKKAKEGTVSQYPLEVRSCVCGRVAIGDKWVDFIGLWFGGCSYNLLRISSTTVSKYSRN